MTGRCELCGLIHPLHEHVASDGTKCLLCKWCLRELGAQPSNEVEKPEVQEETTT